MKLKPDCTCGHAFTAHRGAYLPSALPHDIKDCLQHDPDTGFCSCELYTPPEEAVEEAQLLTQLEQEIIADAGALWGKICRAVPEGPTRISDLEEIVPAIHLIQRYFMGQAAVRAHPNMYRPLGLTIEMHLKENPDA